MNRKRILVVEDEECVRQVLCRQLSAAGFSVSAAGSPRTALTGASGEVDLLITDVILPGMNGKSLAELLSRRNPAMKVLFISGYEEEDFARSGILPQGANFLQKPFTSMSLGESIDRILSGGSAVPTLDNTRKGACA